MKIFNAPEPMRTKAAEPETRPTASRRVEQ